MFLFRGFSGDADFANFSLLWLIPVATLRALSWSAYNEPVLLIAVPILWTALAAGISFFIYWMMSNFRWYTAAISILSILILPLISATVYWAFFSQKTTLGFLLLFIVNIPLMLSFLFNDLRA
jgi:hypothetical protein